VSHAVNESGGEVKPRSLRFTWSMKTTSSRDPNEIMAEIKKVTSYLTSIVVLRSKTFPSDPEIEVAVPDPELNSNFIRNRQQNNQFDNLIITVKR
jgi:hypothetical protein